MRVAEVCHSFVKTALSEQAYAQVELCLREVGVETQGTLVLVYSLFTSPGFPISHTKTVMWQCVPRFDSKRSLILRYSGLNLVLRKINIPQTIPSISEV